MTTTREEFEAWMHAECFQEPPSYCVDLAWAAWQAAHLAGQRAMQERAENACRTVKIHVDGYHLFTANKVRGECSLAVQRLMEVKTS